MGARWLSPNSVLRPACIRQPSQARLVQTPLHFPPRHPDRSRIPLPATDPSSLGLGGSAVGEPRTRELPLPPSPAPRPAHALRPQIPGRKQPPERWRGPLSVRAHCRPPSLLPRLHFTAFPALARSGSTPSHPATGTLLRLPAFPRTRGCSATTAKLPVSRAEPPALAVRSRLLGAPVWQLSPWHPAPRSG